MMKIGWIGMGKMGVPMSEKILRAGHDLLVYNRTKEKAKPLIDQGAQFIDSLGSMLEKVEVIFVMISDDDAVEEIFTGDNGLLSSSASGKVIVNMSTITPEMSKKMAERCKAQQLEYIDAPVSGSVKQAEEASLVIIAGGDEDVVDQVRPLLEKIGKAVVYIGEVGTGNAAKLAVNTFLGIVTQGLAETIKFSKSMGVDAATFLNILKAGALGSPYLNIKSDAVLNDNYKAAFTLDHLAKDLRYAKGSGLKGKVGLATHDTFQEAVKEFGDEDVMAILKHLK
ncbi:NAD(P)-dependent oxidoreductase [Fulvivirga sediminis]|uniref:NAD(P)-dependent oxidoreductase n=1 Tax=Fulvivirga sediminis TaxID=2803949 RepID=A0A937F9A4_9BACT|nr:NAD(P)-dependent oxidoreductase [Fulvivirga sediminis]MBL3656368.1 NAD(P)-dependent oxidoreductase [Fulvivirga sediminis]